MKKFSSKTGLAASLISLPLLLAGCGVGDGDYVKQVDPLSGAPTIKSQREAAKEARALAAEAKAAIEARRAKAAAAIAAKKAEVENAAGAVKEAAKESIAEVTKAVE
ncbi:MAG TPA: hypothetical protein ENJ32_13770 [Crenotrichaceae bacterium]|nr:hypothetical protein [Crenotrichaceae bacterium]